MFTQNFNAQFLIENGISIVIVTHHRLLATDYCDKMLSLRRAIRYIQTATIQYSARRAISPLAQHEDSLWMPLL